MVRKNVRKAARIPGWAMALIIFWAAVIIGYFGLKAIQASTSKWGEWYSRADDLRRDRRFEEAVKVLQEIPADDPTWGERSRKTIKEIIKENEAGQAQYDTLNAQRNYDMNIVYFIQKYIDAPADKPSLARKIKRDHVDDRPSYVRVLLKNRIIPYMERFKNAPQLGDVKKLYNKYSKEVNIDAPPTFRDVEVEADCLQNLSAFGKAYQVMSQWCARHPGQYVDRAEWTYKTIWDRLQEEWKVKQREIAENEADGKPQYAIKKINRMLRLTEGYDSPVGRKFRAELEQRLAENEIKAEAIRRGE